MRITQISINFTETCNLGDYSNTKPSVELTALLEPGDDPHAVLDELTGMAKETLHAKIDDELELVGRSPKYYQGPLFEVVYGYHYRYVAVLPVGQRKKLSGFSNNTTGGEQRYEAALKHALVKRQEIESDGDPCEFFDCANGDLTFFLSWLENAKANYDKRQEERRQQAEAERQRREEEWRQQQAARVEETDDEDFYDEDDEDEDDDEE